MAADDGRVDVGQRRSGDTGGERGGVQLVVGVENQRDVECVGGQASRPIAGQHVEEVRGVPQHRIGRDWPSAGGEASHRGDERGESAP